MYSTQFIFAFFLLYEKCLYFLQYIDSINQHDKSIKIQSFRKLDVETSENAEMLFSIPMNCSLETHFAGMEQGIR